MPKIIPDTFSRDRPQKGLVRDRIYTAPPTGAFREVLLLPGAELLDLQQGFINGCFDDKTNFVLVERDIEIATAIDEYYRNYPGSYELFIDRLETLRPSDLGGRSFDFVNLDTCNAYTPVLHTWLENVLYPSLAEDCVVWLTLTVRLMPGSLWCLEGKGNTDKKPRDWTRDRIEQVFADLVLFDEVTYRDSCPMWVLGFAGGLFVDIYENEEGEEISMDDMTEKQILVYRSLTGAGNKASYRRQLNKAQSPHDKQKVTLKYLKKLGCDNYIQLEKLREEHAHELLKEDVFHP